MAEQERRVSLQGYSIGQEITVEPAVERNINLRRACRVFRKRRSRAKDKIAQIDRGTNPPGIIVSFPRLEVGTESESRSR